MGVSGLSLLAFLGAGYSHLSKDVVEGIRERVLWDEVSFPWEY